MLRIVGMVNELTFVDPKQEWIKIPTEADFKPITLPIEGRQIIGGTFLSSLEGEQTIRFYVFKRSDSN